MRKFLKDPVKERDWPQPRTPSDEQFEFICRKYKLRNNYFEEFRLFLYELVKHVRNYREDVISRGLPSSSANEFRKHEKNIAAAIEFIRRFDLQPAHGSQRLLTAVPFGTEDLSKTASLYLHDVINPLFLVPIIEGTPRVLSRQPIDLNASRAWVDSIVSHHAGTVIAELLERIHQAISTAESALRSGIRRGGRQPYIIGPFVLLNLAHQWARIGRKPGKTAYGPFGEFAVDVVAAMGLPTRWIEGHIKEAVEAWEQRTGKKPPEKI